MTKNYRISLHNRNKETLFVRPVPAYKRPVLLDIADIEGESEAQVLEIFQYSDAASFILESLEKDYDAQHCFRETKKDALSKGDHVPYWLPSRLTYEMRINIQKTNAIKKFTGL